jgi:hypothetical protein
VDAPLGADISTGERAGARGRLPLIGILGENDYTARVAGIRPILYKDGRKIFLDREKEAGLYWKV